MDYFWASHKKSRLFISQVVLAFFMGLISKCKGKVENQLNYTNQQQYVFSPHVFSLCVSVSLVTKMHTFRLTTSKCQVVLVGCNSLTISLHMENKTLNKVSKAIMQSSVPFSPYLKNSPRKKNNCSFRISKCTLINFTNSYVNAINWFFKLYSFCSALISK